METYAYKQMFYSYKTIKALITRKRGRGQRLVERGY